MDLNTLCRLCAESNCTLHPIFASNFVDNNIAEKIHTITPIKVSLEDGLPGMICSLCNDKLNAAFDFRLQIISTDEKLRLHVSTPQLTVKRDPDEWESEPESSPLLPFCEIKSDFTYDDIEDKSSLRDNLEIENSDISENESQDYMTESTPSDESDKSKDGLQPLLRSFEKYKTKQNKKIDKSEVPCVCPKCGKLLKKNSFSDHMLNVHASEATIECNICGKMVKTRRQLWHHKRSHQKESVSCDKCGKIFTTKAGFKRHYDDIHLGIRKHCCNLCEKAFPKVIALKRHMRSHTGERPYICTYCNRGFGDRWNLKQHVRLHTKEKPYICKICNEAFTHNVMMKLHVKNKHKDVVDIDIKEEKDEKPTEKDETQIDKKSEKVDTNAGK